MRSATDASIPLPDQSFGKPKMPTRKTTRIPTITANFQLRFLFIRKPVDRRWSLVVSQNQNRLANDQRLATNDYDFVPSSAGVTDTTDARLISSFRLSGGTRKISASSFRLM